MPQIMGMINVPAINSFTVSDHEAVTLRCLALGSWFLFRHACAQTEIFLHHKPYMMHVLCKTREYFVREKK